MTDGSWYGRRDFLKVAAAATGGALPGVASAQGNRSTPNRGDQSSSSEVAGSGINFPRTFTGRQLREIAFPLGGIGTGSISLGGRGNLRDWEIFNRADKGRSPKVALPTIFAQWSDGQTTAKVIEAEHQPPFDGHRFWDDNTDCTVGLPRFRLATFAGAFPFAKIQFSDQDCPLTVTLESFSPFIPLDADQSGLPIIVLRYRVHNPLISAARVSIGYSLENPIYESEVGQTDDLGSGRANEVRRSGQVSGLLMRNLSTPKNHPITGTVALAVIENQASVTEILAGWDADLWWSSPMHFWDQFKSNGKLGSEPKNRNFTGSVAQSRHIPGNGVTEFTFLLTWHFPNRTPERCGWDWLAAFFPPDQATEVRKISKEIIGNYYCTKFEDAWAVATNVSSQLSALENRSRRFFEVLKDSTHPACVLDAATANLSTLVTNTCFRSEDGIFHGFEGSQDNTGSCAGDCTHVWNYEATVPFLFPQLSRQLRDSAFGFCTHENGLMDHRQVLPAGRIHLPVAVADGQMGAIMKLYLDWRLSGDKTWLQSHWPAAKRALEFAWIEGGWDSDRDGVMEGLQNNTYDVAFLGPNPLSGILYLGALRAAEEMALAVGDRASAREYRSLFVRGSGWIDAHLFNGQYYRQEVRSLSAKGVASGLTFQQFQPAFPPINMENPQFQLGEGCLADQLLGQYLAHLAGIGRLLDAAHVRAAIHSIARYNFKSPMREYAGVMRSFAVNEESAVVLCDYSLTKRPSVPFPYFSEVFTGSEYALAALMIYEGFADLGVNVIEHTRMRFDGERRNPWNEQEAGHHYARAMSAWGALVALSGFRYHAGEGSVEIVSPSHCTRSIWSTATGWGKFVQIRGSTRLETSLTVLEGKLRCSSFNLPNVASINKVKVTVDRMAIACKLRHDDKFLAIELKSDLNLIPDQTVAISV
jgi:uncharacterized protein (DUF608 family)